MARLKPSWATLVTEIESRVIRLTYRSILSWMSERRWCKLCPALPFERENVSLGGTYLTGTYFLFISWSSNACQVYTLASPISSLFFSWAGDREVFTYSIILSALSFIRKQMLERAESRYMVNSSLKGKGRNKKKVTDNRMVIIKKRMLVGIILFSLEFIFYL